MIQTRLVVLFKVDLYPYVRTTKKQMYVDPSYQKYNNAKQQIAQAAGLAMAEQGITLPEKTPLRLALFYQVQGYLHRRDLSNVIKGVEDGMQHVAFGSDAWIDQFAAVRTLVKHEEHRGVAVLQPIREGPELLSDWLNEVEPIADEQGVTILP